jgi:hypothetical protein
MFGVHEGRRIERRWTLIASDGDGPEIPALSVPLLVTRTTLFAAEHYRKHATSQTGSRAPLLPLQVGPHLPLQTLLPADR